jgi:hypothetical protein
MSSKSNGLCTYHEVKTKTQRAGHPEQRLGEGEEEYRERERRGERREEEGRRGQERKESTGVALPQA